MNKEDKIFFCIHCGKDLRKVGFQTVENVWKRFDWTWDKKKGFFQSKEMKVWCGEGMTFDDLTCENCGGAIGLDILGL